MVKAHKISTWAFRLMILVSCAVFICFFFVGYENQVGKYNAPEHTDTLLYLLYAMIGLCIVATVGGALGSLIGSIGGPKGVNKTGVPVTAISVVSMVILVGSLLVSYLMASTDPLVMPNGSVYDDTAFLVMTDTFIYTLYALVVITIVGLVINLSGIFKR